MTTSDLFRLKLNNLFKKELNLMRPFTVDGQTKYFKIIQFGLIFWLW